MEPGGSDYSRRFNLLGQLKDRQKERSFQEEQLPATRTRMRFVCGMTPLAYLAAIYADCAHLAGQALAVLITARILVALIGVAAFVVTLNRKVSIRQLGLATGAYMVALIAVECLELALKAGQAPLPETPITVFIVLLYYLYLPPQIWQSLVAGGLGSVAYLLTLVFLTDASSGHISNTFLIFALANGFGLYFCIRFGAAQRREHLALEELKRRAEIDSLTGIYNRRRVMELGDGEFESAKKHGYPFSLLMLDIDHFKTINDTLGHAAGDAVLAGFAGRCARKLREEDLFGRIGGEEFIVFMPNSPGDQAFKAAQRLLQFVHETPFAANGDKVRTTVSIGVAELDQSTPTLDKLLQAADASLYRAKQQGRDRACLSDTCTLPGRTGTA